MPLPQSGRKVNIIMDLGKSASVSHMIDLIIYGKYKFERYDKNTQTLWATKVSHK